MSKNPIILALTFVLEIAGLGAVAYWGLTQHEGLLSYVLGLGLPIVIILIWGTFRVNGDPKEAIVPIAGWLRLLIEVVFYAGAVLALVGAGLSQLAVVLLVAALIIYGLSYDRLVWLVKQKPAPAVKPSKSKKRK